MTDRQRIENREQRTKNRQTVKPIIEATLIVMNRRVEWANIDLIIRNTLICNTIQIQAPTDYKVRVNQGKVSIFCGY